MFKEDIIYRLNLIRVDLIDLREGSGEEGVGKIVSQITELMDKLIIQEWKGGKK